MLMLSYESDDGFYSSHSVYVPSFNKHSLLRMHNGSLYGVNSFALLIFILFMLFFSLFSFTKKLSFYHFMLSQFQHSRFLFSSMYLLFFHSELSYFFVSS